MPYTVGVLMTKPYQILDAVGAIEILGMVRMVLNACEDLGVDLFLGR
jgi:hypothetical protein